MKIQLRDGLPFVSVSLMVDGKQITCANVLLDTGSAGTVFAAAHALAIGLRYEPSDAAHRICGVGGTEFVFSKQVDLVRVGDLAAKNFSIEVGAMDYGFEMDGIIGVDWLTQVGAVIDLAQLEIR
ncbi:MAG: retropepsin-like domain-containing protein [Chloroflexi bacterium]|nr:retropepsin-like domain-containing protein [Chloroflexota bacterium]